MCPKWAAGKAVRAGLPFARRLSKPIRNRRATRPPAHFRRNPPGRGRRLFFRDARGRASRQHADFQAGSPKAVTSTAFRDHQIRGTEGRNRSDILPTAQVVPQIVLGLI
jgi:hypothetical protein